MSVDGRRSKARWPVERTVALSALAVLVALYALFSFGARWAGSRWWERASYETAHGRNIYPENYQARRTRTESEPWFAYTSGSLYVTVPLYLMAWSGGTCLRS